jgi:alkylation response protein AidB-like acyl-CoA dehydrogenase
MGATLTQQIILFEEMSRIGAPTPYPHGLNFIGPLIVDAGTPAQKAEHLPKILSGEVTWCQGYSEAGAGSTASPRRAEPDGGDFINGHKMWTTNGHLPIDVQLVHRPQGAAAPRRHSMLLIDAIARHHRASDPDHQGDAELPRNLRRRVRAARYPLGP